MIRPPDPIHRPPMCHVRRIWAATVAHREGVAPLVPERTNVKDSKSATCPRDRLDVGVLD